MYLASRVGHWSTTAIGRFYGGRDHSTVCYGIQRIQALRETDPNVDALLTELKRQLGQDRAEAPCGDSNGDINPADCLRLSIDQLADLVAARVCAYLESRLRHSL